MTDAKQLLAATKAIQADVDALGLDGPRKPDPERLRLLEAVAEAMLAAYVAYGLGGDGPAAQLDEAMGVGMEALAQLGELYYSSGAGKILGEEALAALEKRSNHDLHLLPIVRQGFGN